MAKEKKAFKDTIFGKIVGKAGDLLADSPAIIATALTGDVKGAASMVVSDLWKKQDDPKAKEILNELMLKMKEIELEFARVELQETIAKEENITKRWEADMHSDSWLSKNARPIGFYWVLLMVTLISILSWCGVELSDHVMTLFNTVSGAIVGGYFILRTVEKRNSKKYKH